MTLKNIFFELASRFSDNEKLIATLWAEIEKHYSSKKRHYHNLAHLENMINELEAVRKQIADFDVILFSVFYHDVVYKPTAGDNEEKSAAFARERLKMLAVDQKKIDSVSQQIIATKKHEKATDADTNYLLDADLSVLGKDWQTYATYTTQIRKEYAVYPDLLYKPGRKKVLQHFLSFPHVYKTTEFEQKYGQRAKMNLAAETERMSQ